MSTEVKTFCRRTAAFLAIGIALYAAVHAVAARAAPRFADHQRRFDQLAANGGSIEGLIVGNSLCCSVDWDVLGLTGYELRHPGSDVFEAAYVIEQALPHLPRLRTVFLPLGFTALHWDNSLRSEMRSELYATYGAFRPIGGRWDGLVMGLLAPTVRPDNGQELLGRLVGRAPARGELDAWGRIDHEVVPIAHRRARLDSQATTAVERHLRIAGDVDASRPDAAEDALATLAELAHELAARDVELVLFLPPFHETYLRRFRETDRGKAVVQELRERLRALDRAHANATFLDASAHPELSRVSANYRTCDHLSDAGARSFSRFLRQRLRDVLR